VSTAKTIVAASWGSAMSWILLFLWFGNGVIRPVTNTTGGASIVPIQWEYLLGFSGL
jgi:hypothetical protein